MSRLAEQRAVCYNAPETAALADSVLNTAYSRFGVHRAAVLGSGGSAYVREDIGRHNACDMAIAAAYLAGEDPGSCALALSGRVTTEILYKAVRAGIPAVYTTKYPSDLASEEARRLGVTVYSVPRRPKASRHNKQILSLFIVMFRVFPNLRRTVRSGLPHRPGCR